MSKDSVRGVHVSPGIYSKESVLTYAAKSLGITTLGLVGETKKGPAFEPVAISDWEEFEKVFGGTSAEKFKGSQYPKYELPYVAKSYLTESNQLQVCRVLGLSGYEAGPAWVITADKKSSPTASTYDEKMVVAVLRSRGEYKKYYNPADALVTSASCDCDGKYYDKLVYEVGEMYNKENCSGASEYNMKALEIAQYVPVVSTGNNCAGYTYSGGQGDWASTLFNPGKFTLRGVRGPCSGTCTYSSATSSQKFSYGVSLNSADPDYILKVLGTDPLNGDAPIYVETLYDVALMQGIAEGLISGITSSLSKYNVYKTADYSQLDPVAGIADMKNEQITMKYLGQRFLVDKAFADKCASADTADTMSYHVYKYNIEKGIFGDKNDTGAKLVLENPEVGQVVTVRQYTDTDGKRRFFYTVPVFSGESGSTDAYNAKADKIVKYDSGTPRSTLVYVNDMDAYYKVQTVSDKSDVVAVQCDMNNYKSSYRFSSTPWFVSQIKGDANHQELKKLFRLHTISDGDNSVNEIKVSIENIRPDDNTFDVVLRDFYDTDGSQNPVEKFSRCSMNQSSENFIGYKIGTFDGLYESKSRYVTVEVADSLDAQHSVPCGFLGYPLGKLDGNQVTGSTSGVVNPTIAYNTIYDPDIKNKKQYFGLSNLAGVDVDTFIFKGKEAYHEDNPDFLSRGFHLDSRLGNIPSGGTVTVDGVEGFEFDIVGASVRTSTLSNSPIIATEEEMDGSIFEYVNLRKFTAYFYGGFDGWDPYRTYRSNTDDFKMSNYKGNYGQFTNGTGEAFDMLQADNSLNLNQGAISSDWYAYLGGIRQFANPEEVDINVFATPGIDLVNNKSLAEEAISMIEEERADSIYVATFPDKPFGAGDFVDEMYTPEDAVAELEYTDIDSNYTCTYYPWIKYHDAESKQYIYLPPTRDVVKNMAKTDNTSYPWFSVAGISRGDTTGVRAHYTTKLADEDTLYEGRINPIKTFSKDGVKIWGNKTLQAADNPLNRINTRRLMLRVRKLIAISVIGMIFDQYDDSLVQRFISTVTPILENVKANRGITDYRVKVNVTSESKDRHELPAEIYIKPTNSLEFISISFVVTNQGVNFDEI